MQVHGALSEQHCGLIKDVYDRSAIHLRPHKLYGGQLALDWSELRDVPGVQEMLRPIVHKCVARIDEFFGLKEDLQPESLNVAKLGTGGRVTKHADNCRQNKLGDWVPNHTPWTGMSALYYLNSDFEGGEIVFEQHNVTIKPHRGLLIAFPSDHHHLHEVLPVRAGSRYSLQLWFTGQEAFAIGGLSIPRRRFRGHRSSMARVRELINWCRTYPS